MLFNNYVKISDLSAQFGFMEILLDNNLSYMVQSYSAGIIQINDNNYTKSIILTPDNIISWSPQKINDITIQHCQILVDLKPDVVIMGCGRQQVFPRAEILSTFAQAGIGVEVMDTGAACRTYNVLMLELRQVIAALLPT